LFLCLILIEDFFMKKFIVMFAVVAAFVACSESTEEVSTEAGVNDSTFINENGDSIILGEDVAYPVDSIASNF